MMKDNKGIGWLNNIAGKISYANKANGLPENDTICAIVESAEGIIYLMSERCTGKQCYPSKVCIFSFCH